MKPWSVDAREAIKDIADIKNSLIEETEGIKDFLYKDKCYFVVATKGLGKSLLLLTKRKFLQDTAHLFTRKKFSQNPSYTIMPSNTLLDVPKFTILNLGEASISILRDKDAMELLWSMSIVISILKNLRKDEIIADENISSSLKRLFKGKSKNVSEILTEIVSSMDRDTFFGELTTDYNLILIPTIRTIKEHVMLFIDNVDECFEHAGKEIWNTAQSSLVRAMYTLIRLVPGKLKLFASIRKEAFITLKENNAMFLQYDGVSLDISYDENELKNIFIKNINAEAKENEERILKKDLLRIDPICAFIGTKEIQHGHVNEKEDIFKYISRHTLQRPRDFMVIGNKISMCPIATRDPTTRDGISKIKNLINEAATKIAENYIEENAPHLTIEKKDLDRVFGLINSNILEEKKVKEICMQFNGNKADCMQKNCKKCKKTHIFCQLFKMGLLGYVTEEPTEEKISVQKFAKVGERMFETDGLLPNSNHYLIHPILDQLIRTKNSEYKDKIDKVNIVGCDRPWKVIKQVPSENINRPTLFISSTMDLKEYRDRIEEEANVKGYAVIRSEQQNDRNALKKCQNNARTCNFFVAVLGPRYGEEFNGKSICEHEFDAAFKDNPRKIIVYMIEGDINRWEPKQRIFAQKIQNIHKLGYARGERVSKLNIKTRLEKDLLEKINSLTKPMKMVLKRKH